MLLTPLERAILRVVADHNWPQFVVDHVDAVRREDTGVGRYTHLLDHAEQPIPDGSYGAADHFVQMDGVPGGLFFIVEVANSRVAYIEIVSSGGDAWDGVERAWTIA
jgi:hypothetical protein